MFSQFGFSGLAFGRSRSGSLWVITGVPAGAAVSFGQAIAGLGCSVSRVGCSVQSGRVWFAFSAPESVVVQLAVELPLAPGSRSHRLLAGAVAQAA